MPRLAEHPPPLLAVTACALLTGCGLVLDLDPAADPEPPDAAAFDAAPSPRDAQARDATPPADAACLPRLERCDGLDDDCDGAVDEDFDFGTDPAHCGGCGNVCPVVPNAVTRCADEACVFECAPRRADCDDDASNGCEADLGAAETCGDCDVECSSTAPICAPASIGFACANTCSPPGRLCDGLCVDPRTDERHCGGCGTSCFRDDHGTVLCQGGACTVTDCGDHHDDCNGRPDDGCEASLNSDPLNCGGCGVACATGQVCRSGTCSAP